METINIKSRMYDYSVDFVDNLSKEIENLKGHSVFVIDKNVFQLYNELFNGVDKNYIYLMNAIEDDKNMDTVMEIIYSWKSLGITKDWKVLCFGGGITQDVTTVASCLYLRNMDWYFFPTTLLSMCDSCIGGKCGINLGKFKNQIGVFYPPKKIFIDTHFLETLSNDDYLNGWGEILKFSLTSDKAFYEDLKREGQYIPCENISSYIYRGLQVKKAIIEEDEFESDLRRVLNYGHTFGHALEAYTNHAVPHGKAVIWGIDVVNYIAVHEGLISNDDYHDIKSLIMQEFLREEVQIEEPVKLFDIIRTDKKVRGNMLSFAMPSEVGKLIIHPMAIDDGLKSLFMDYLEETHNAYNSD